MTDIFNKLKQIVDDPVIGLDDLSDERTQSVCLYQIATSLNEIDKTLKHIETELKGIKGRV